jgi:4-hydroxy-3-methylbut-2-enyl diphosphate reductase
MNQDAGTNEANQKASPTIEVAAGSGVCFGVQRAIRLAEEALGGGEPVYCLGPLIHNPQEMQRLGKRGFRVIESLDEAGAAGILLVRSHGLGPDVVEQARARGLRIVDATCPLVRRVQTLAVELVEQGYRVIVAGEAAHPEVRAILGHAPGASVVGSVEDLAALDLGGRVALVAQTTFSPDRFQEMAAAMMGRDLPEVRVVDTICAATVDRQRAAAQLAERVDVMIVLGGRNSANTNRLAERCRAHGVETYHLEHAGEVRAEHLRGRRRVGIAAGASTPHWIIEATLERIRDLQSRKQ